MMSNLSELSIVGTLTVADVLVSAITTSLGAFAAAYPRQAAELWASERLRNMPGARQVSFVRWYRVFGIVLFLTGCALLHR